MRTGAALSLSLLACMTALAGCSEDSSDGSEPAPSSGTQYEDDLIEVDVPTLPRDPPAAGERTVGQVPVWRLGEWWTYTMNDHFTGTSLDFTRVVAGTERGNYLVGFPEDAFSNQALIFHAPCFGDVGQADLSCEVHDAVHQLLRFPLVAGETWDMSWEGFEGLAEVQSVEGGQAVVEAHGTGALGFNITATFDAETGDVLRWVFPGYADFEVTGHGFGYEGVVRVPHAHDLLMQHGRVAGVQDIGGAFIPPTPAAPTETVTIEGIYDRFGFVLIVGSFPLGPQGAAQGPGYYRETLTAPNGTVYQLEMTPDESATGPFKAAFFGHDLPQGEWTLEHLAAGPGIAFAEGIGYHSIDVDLPSGCVVRSFNAEHHSAACRVNPDVAGGVDGNATAMS